MGPLNGRPAWNQVSAPELAGTYTASQATEVNGSKGSKGSSYVASQNISSKTGSNPEDKQGTYTSAQKVQAVGNGNVKYMPSKTPDGNDVGSNAAMWGGRGMGGY